MVLTGSFPCGAQHIWMKMEQAKGTVGTQRYVGGGEMNLWVLEYVIKHSKPF